MRDGRLVLLNKPNTLVIMSAGIGWFNRRMLRAAQGRATVHVAGRNAIRTVIQRRRRKSRGPER